MTITELKTAGLTALALLAFAGNSVLCRLALDSGQIDAGSFTVIRLVSGALALWILLALRHAWAASAPQPEIKEYQERGHWCSAALLFTYAAAFSYAYLSLDTGVGALILFACVQFTMIGYGLWRGQRLNSLEWLGLGLALIGFVYLIYPDLTSPSFIGFVLMALAGIAWGGYSLMGRGAPDPMGKSARNFIFTAPFVAVLALASLNGAEITPRGAALAIASGALASGLGYAVWYAALQNLSPTLASVSQLLVPVIAAVGGVLWVGEPLGLRLLVSGLLVLGGIFLVISARRLHYNNS